MPRIVLNAGAEACLKHHLNIKARSLLDTLCLQELILALKVRYSLLHLLPDISRRLNHLLARHNIVRSREYCHMRKLRLLLTGKHIYLREPVYLIPEELNPYSPVRGCRREYLKHISSYPEGASLKIHVISGILIVDKLPYNLVPVLLHTRTQRYNHALVIYRASKSIYA